MKTQIRIRNKDNLRIVDKGILNKIDDRFIYIEDTDTGEIIKYDRVFFFSEKPLSWI